jgi:serine/threonine protein kinase
MRSASLGYVTLASSGVAFWLIARNAPGISIALSIGVIAVLIVYVISASIANRRGSARQSFPRPVGPAPVSARPSAPHVPPAPRPAPPAPPPITNTAAQSSANANGSSAIVGGRYRCLRMLGEGGMKRVYVAEDLHLNNRLCAVAELIDSAIEPAQQRANRAAFEREADLLAELGNEHIPKIFDRFSEGPRHYLVMEYVPGETLEQWVKDRGGRVDQATALYVGGQILEGLVYLHSRIPPIAYRDLKPDNVMVTPENRVRLVDFGIARHFTRALATAVGSQGYAAPEQYKGRVDPRTDIFAFGALMHRLLSGRDPQSETPFTFPPLAEMRPDIDPRLAQLIDRCLSYDAAQRPQHAAEVVAAIKAIALPVSSTTAAPNGKIRTKPHAHFCVQCGAQLPSRGKCANCGSARYAN